MAVTSHPLDDERLAARVRAFRLIYDIQGGVDDALETLGSLADQAARDGIPEIALIASFGKAVHDWLHRQENVAQSVATFVEEARVAGNDVMLALGLALHCDRGFSGTTAPNEATDLARAVVLLEESDGAVLERITAHTACGIAFANRSMFELADEQYRTALSIGEKEPPEMVDFLLAPIRFNLAELDVAWASMLLQLGDAEGIEKRWSTWEAATSATTAYDIPQAWVKELTSLGLLLKAIAGFDARAEAQSLLAELGTNDASEGRAIALLELAIAIAKTSSGDPDDASAAERAVQAIDPDTHPQLHDLALNLCAQIEARNGHAAGLRYARRQLLQRWSVRLESLASMESAIRAERLSAERDLLSTHVRRDDLTGIANRRALDEYLSDRPQNERVALIIFDIDGFKRVNDVHGHLVGDAVLTTIAQLLASGIRSSDLAVRLGGDEFAVVLAGADLDTALDRAKALLSEVDRQNFANVSAELVVALSAGVAAGDAAHVTDMWASADAAMYRAKAGNGIALARSRVGAGDSPERDGSHT